MKQPTATLLLHAPDQEKPWAVPVPEGHAALVGRSPSIADIDEELRQALSWATLRPVALPGRWVSANHLLVSNHPEEGLELWDLHSRNGSKLTLGAGQRLRLQGGGDVVLELGGVERPDRRQALGRPSAPDWGAPEEFGPSLAHSVSEWMQRLGLGGTVRAVPLGDAPSGDNLLLADDTELSIAWPSSGTLSPIWPHALERLREFISEQNLRFEQLRGVEEDLIIASRSTREAYWQLANAAVHGMRVMILGPTGSGKERMARAYHRHSRRFQGPFAAVNCAMLKEDLLYAQLFGAKRGSFTGAASDLPGLVEEAHEGTLFLDEVGDMDQSVQRALLRFLDSHGEYHRLGDGRPRRADVQIVCATNQPIDEMGPSRNFREDLWYRLAVRVIRLKPLRERPEDVQAFLRARTVRGGGLSVYAALAPDALELLTRDPLPGNFRDLGNFVERLPAVRREQAIGREACAQALYEGRSSTRLQPTGPQLTTSAASAGSGDWTQIAQLASAAFVKDHGAAPNNWSQMQLFVEKYLKPVFVAHSSGMSDANELGKGTNYSELARRLNIADGTTVKMHLNRYIERFRRSAPE